MSKLTKPGEQISEVIYETRAEKWHGVYYPGLPCLPMTDEELEQLAKVHGYELNLVRGLYVKAEEKKDASNPST